jgi:hypothetical protein
MLTNASLQAIALALQPTPAAPEPLPPAKSSETLLTLDELAWYLSANGYKITPRYLAKLSTPLVNQGPPFETWWGSRKLFRPSIALEWAKARCRDQRNVAPKEVA